MKLPIRSTQNPPSDASGESACCVRHSYNAAIAGATAVLHATDEVTPAIRAIGIALRGAWTACLGTLRRDRRAIAFYEYAYLSVPYFVDPGVWHVSSPCGECYRDQQTNSPVDSAAPARDGRTTGDDRPRAQRIRGRAPARAPRPRFAPLMEPN